MTFVTAKSAHRPPSLTRLPTAAATLALGPWPSSCLSPIAEMAVKTNTHFASTSYISEAMEGMDAQFKVFA